MSPRRLCRIDEVPEGEGRSFRFGSGPDLETVFVVKKGGALYAYANSCPHFGTPLNFLPDRFFTRDGQHLLCATHGAVFRIEDGVCIDGPCAGKRLKALALRVDEGELLLLG